MTMHKLLQNCLFHSVLSSITYKLSTIINAKYKNLKFIDYFTKIIFLSDKKEGKTFKLRTLKSSETIGGIL